MEQVESIVAEKYKELTQWMNRKERRSKLGKQRLMYAQHAAITAGVTYLEDKHGKGVTEDILDIPNTRRSGYV